MSITQLYSKAGISVWRKVWVTTVCCCMSDMWSMDTGRQEGGQRETQNLRFSSQYRWYDAVGLPYRWGP